MASNELILEEIKTISENTLQNGLAIAVIQTHIEGINKRLDERNPFIQILLNTSSGIGRLLFASAPSRFASTIIVLILISIGSLAGLSRMGFGVQEAIGNVDKMMDQAERIKDLTPLGDDSFIGPRNIHASTVTGT